jgi:hypothetical protein
MAQACLRSERHRLSYAEAFADRNGIPQRQISFPVAPGTVVDCRCRALIAVMSTIGVAVTGERWSTLHSMMLRLELPDLFAPYRGRDTISRLLSLQRANNAQLQQANRDKSPAGLSNPRRKLGQDASHCYELLYPLGRRTID